MTKKLFKIALIIILIINIGGCAELRRKFIRKKESAKQEFSFYRPEGYMPKPPHERYQDHYVLWHNWHLDLERMEGTSHLRDMRAVDESLRHLTAMRDLLMDEKAEGLNTQIKQMEAVKTRLQDTRRDIVNDPHSRKIVEKVERIIINDFTYNRMKDYIKSDSSELEEKGGE